MAQRKGLIFGISVVVTLAFAAFMGSQVKPLNSGDIISFEFAFTMDRVNILLEHWQERNVIYNAFVSLYLDFIFLVLYSATLTFGARWAAARLQPGLFQRSAHWLSGNTGWAGVCDAIENCCLLMLLQQYTYAALPILAALFAGVRFFIVLRAIITIIRSFFK